MMYFITRYLKHLRYPIIRPDNSSSPKDNGDPLAVEDSNDTTNNLE